MLTDRFVEALAAAVRYHDGQVRKTNHAPYVSHPMQVAGIALEFGADEDQAIAALLHDVLEDTDETAENLARRFGERVARIVVACTDTTVRPKPPWRERKEAYLRGLAEVHPDAALVIASDKLHNARSLLTEYARQGDDVWDAFRGKRDGTVWYYTSLPAALRDKAPDDLVDELARQVEAIHRAAADGVA